MRSRAAFFVALAVLLQPLGASAQDFAAQARTMLRNFENQFEKAGFATLVRLGDPALIDRGINTNLDLEVNPSFHIPGKYYPPEARWGSMLRTDSLLVVRDLSGTDAASAVTVWHEFKHHLVRILLGKQDCGAEEVYMVLLEDRVTWLQKAAKTVDLYNKEPQLHGILKMRRAWKELTEDWAGKKWKDRNLSGPFTAEDSDNTCSEGAGKRFTIDAGFMSRFDQALGIDVDIAKIRQLYKRLDERLPNISGTWCLERGQNWGPMTITAHQTEDELKYTLKGVTMVGDFVDANTLQFFNGPTLAARGTIAADGKRIAWSNGSFWNKAAAACDADQVWTGVYVYEQTTVRIQETGPGSITATEQWIAHDDGKPKPHRNVGQWHNCKIEGNKATCNWTASYTDPDKDMQRNGVLTATLTGDSLRIVAKEARPVATWRVPEYPSSMHEGKVWDTTFTRQKCGDVQPGTGGANRC